MSVNKAILVGNVGNDPEIQYVQTDVPVARFRLATNETYKDKNGQRQTVTEWHNVVLWRGLAKVVEQYVKKGAKLYIEGKITNRQYEKDGVTKYFTEIVAREMKMLDSRGEGESNYTAPANQTQNAVKQNTTASVPNNDAPPMDSYEEVDDLPF
jgi:single-strand DNA-binding protein